MKSYLSRLSQEEIATAISELNDHEAEAILHDWELWARPEQLEPPGNWRTWLILAGRGYGKTRTGAETVVARVKAGKCGRVALVAPTAADVRDTVVEGESGILSISPNNFRPRYEPSRRRLIWPNGAIATTYSAEEPDRLRGPQQDFAWCDELAAWKYPEAYDQLQFGLRLGSDPRQIITTTPRPTKIIKTIASDPTTIITKGSTYDNKANLAPAFLQQIIKKYENTRLGRQELDAEILEDNPNALWKRDQIDALRVNNLPQSLKRVVVGVDPAVTNNEKSNETGIIIAAKGSDDHGYILNDLTISASPDGWGRQVVEGYHFYQADRIIAEVNNGGDLVEAIIRTIDANVPFTKVHASRGKAKRAEPIAALYEQGRVHHLGCFPKLEDQMCNFDPSINQLSDSEDESPDRMDALVWALTELFENTSFVFSSI